MWRITRDVQQARDVGFSGVVPWCRRIVVIQTVVRRVASRWLRQQRVPVRHFITPSQTTALRAIRYVLIITIIRETGMNLSRSLDCG
jgi:hypothetical protein